MASSSGHKRSSYLRLQTLLIDGGTMVFRQLFDDRISPSTLSVHLANNQGVISKLIRQGKITKQQLHPQGLTSSSSDFDMTVLYCLLRNICGLRSSSDPVWSGPQASDLSVEADICRLKNSRNELAHMNSTSGIADQEFQKKWSDIEQVLLRLNSSNKNQITNLKAKLDEFKTIPIDEEAEERYDKEIKAWQELDENIESALSSVRLSIGISTTKMVEIADETHNLCRTNKNIEKSMCDLCHKIDHMMTPDQRNLHEYSEQYFKEKEKLAEFYVKTSAHDEARRKLQLSGCVILAGNQGEGKTTMGSYLLLEISPRSKILKLAKPSDWRIPDWKKLHCNAVLIDDMFGATILEEELLHSWETYLTEMEYTVKSGIQIVITTRLHIFKAAQKKMKKSSDLLKEENSTQVSSTMLGIDTKMNILIKHLSRYNRESQLDVLQESIHKHWEQRSNEDRNLSIGFPECAAMFASTEILFRKGADFFKAPLRFFKKCLHELFKNEEEFVALMLVWAMPEGKLCVRDLERKAIPKELFEVLDYPLELGQTNKLKRCLEDHAGGLLNYNRTSGTYSFRHSVIGDVVGIIAGRQSPTAVIKYGSKAFLMKYVSVNPEREEDEDVFFVEEFRVPDLSERLCQLFFRKPSKLNLYGEESRLREKGLKNMKLCPPFMFPDVSILSHEAFDDVKFMEQFVIDLKHSKLINTPIAEVYEHFKKPYSVVFKFESKGMCIPSFLAAKGKQTLFADCLKHNIISEAEKELSLMIAVHNEDWPLIESLLNAGTNVSEEALQIACFKDNEILNSLLQYRTSKLTNFDNIENNNSPLITASKRGMCESIADIVRVSDIDYRNKNGLSALDMAIIENHIDVCRILVQCGSQLNIRGGKFNRTPLHRASDMGRLEIVRLLIEAGADVNVQDHREEYPVHSAAIQGHYDIVKLLLERNKTLANKPLNAHGRQNLKGMTSFHYAIANDDDILFRILIEFGVNPNIPDKYERTPIYYASVNGKQSFVQMLIGYADINKAEKNGYTPLHAAVYKRELEVVKLLAGAVNVNIQDKRGNTALHVACQNADAEIVSVLLSQRDIDIRIVNKRRDTVFHVLRSWDENETRSKRDIALCIKILQEKDPYFVQNLKHIKNSRSETAVLQSRGLYFLQ